MKVIVDAMGGDKGPSVVVKGVVDTFLEKRSKIKEVLLVGREEVLLSELNKYQEYNLPIQVVNASEVITMEESPALAVRSKKILLWW